MNAAQAAQNHGYAYCFAGGTINGPTPGKYDSQGSDGSYSNCNNVGKTGFDCTGLTLYAVYQGTGNAGLTHDGYQAKSGGGHAITNKAELQPGDVVYFDHNASHGLGYIDHSGIYVGNGMVLSAASERFGIRTESINWYEAGGLHFVGAVRYWSDTTPPASGPASSGGSEIENLNAGRCLDVPGATTTAGTAVQMYDCNGTAAQQWLPVNGSLQVYGNPECLDVRGGNLTSGTPVQLWPCNGTEAQHWTINPDGTITTTNGLCLDVQGAATSNGTAVQVYTCNGTAAQRWTGPRLPNGGSEIENSNASRCVDVPGATSNPGTALQIYDCNGTAAQQWLAVNGALQVYGNECLDVRGGDLTSGTAVQLWSCNGTPAQHWKINPNGTITTANGLCLDVQGAGTGNGTGVQIYACNGTAAQQWAGPRLPNGGTAVTNPAAGRCLDVPAGTSDQGTALQIYDCNGTAAQQWLAVNSALQVYGNECLDVRGGDLTSGTPVQLWSCNGTPAQHWKINPNGTITTTNGLCLDVQGAATSNGTAVQVYACNGTAAQQWTGFSTPTNGATEPPGPGGSQPDTPSGAPPPPVACIVPKLRGVTLARARVMLRRAHCRLGRVHRPKKKLSHRRLRVATQSSRAGSRHTSGYHVNVSLKAAK